MTVRNFEQSQPDYKPILAPLANEQDEALAFGVQGAVFGSSAGIESLRNGYLRAAVDSYHAVETMGTDVYQGYKRQQHNRRIGKLKDGHTVFALLSLQAEALECIVNDKPLPEELAAEWDSPANQRLERLLGRRRMSLGEHINTSGQNPEDLLGATQRMLEQTYDGLETLYGGLALGILAHCAEFSQFERFKTGKAALDFTRQLNDIRNTDYDTPVDFARAKQRLFRTIWARVRLISESVAMSNPIGSTWKDMAYNGLARIRNGQSISNLSQESSAYDFLMHARSMSASYTDWTVKSRVVGESFGLFEVNSPGSEPENIHETNTGYEELTGHLAQLSLAHQAIGDKWSIRKSQLKAAGLHELSRSFVAGAKGKDWEIAGIPKNKAWQTLGVLHKCAELLPLGQSLAQEKLYSDEVLENAIANDYAHILDWLKNAGIKNVSTSIYGELEPTLTLTIDYLRNNWPNIKPAIEQNWPAATRPNIGELERLIFSIPLDMEEHDEKDATEPQDSHIEEPNVNHPPINIDPALAEIAEQLDWVVLPPMPFSELRGFVASLYSEEQLSFVDWSRLENLTTIQEATGGKLHRSKHGALGTTTPYFVLTFELTNSSDGNSMTFAVAENPLYANATYIVREDLADGSWQKVLNEYKRNARVLGAHQIIHAPGADHLAKVRLALQDLATVKSKVSSST